VVETGTFVLAGSCCDGRKLLESLVLVVELCKICFVGNIEDCCGSSPSGLSDVMLLSFVC